MVLLNAIGGRGVFSATSTCVDFCSVPSGPCLFSMTLPVLENTPLAPLEGGTSLQAIPDRLKNPSNSSIPEFQNSRIQKSQNPRIKKSVLSA
jgi:hypothetical protein